MRTNWIVTNSNGVHTFDTARNASAFVQASMDRHEYFELDAPPTLSAEDRKYFGAMLIEATFEQK
ncbi:hypothetical protein DTW90_22725 [Neorhizobium sp. P12A]|uniref:hypothetical protein n=1 Tax=Rhizobium/Agrobacterium group TaxID=227290 RepID=UPI0010447E56|nr:MULTISPECIES: hypothetical protein [Rhizobium/Agrobacterium group]KAA0695390.1 hypothetical protein DTW90_22725 [Neorhizobium sp. P12A]TCR64488.1 hypothetical protein EV561_1651 [Rhizobium sp. BK376]